MNLVHRDQCDQLYSLNFKLVGPLINGCWCLDHSTIERPLVEAHQCDQRGCGCNSQPLYITAFSIGCYAAADYVDRIRI